MRVPFAGRLSEWWVETWVETVEELSSLMLTSREY